MPQAAQSGLAHLRGRLKDAGTLERLEQVLPKGGNDLGSFLSHQGVPQAEVTAARSALLKAQQPSPSTVLLFALCVHGMFVTHCAPLVGSK